MFLRERGFWVLSGSLSVTISHYFSAPASLLLRPLLHLSSALTLPFFQASPTGGFLDHTVIFLFIAGLRNVI